MTKYGAAILEVAGTYLGMTEYPGAKHNEAVVDMFRQVGHGWVEDDETPWCAAFVGSVLAQIGIPHTGKLNARSYLDWGQPVPLRQVQPGDVCVLSRGNPSGPYGHVGFVVRFDGGSVVLRGGNQGNKVSDEKYPMSRVIGFRRADGGSTEAGQPVLKYGSRGAFVLDLQSQLAALGYTLGKADGIFGDKTRAAVLAFQGDNGLDTDGIVGRVTWEALEGATPRAKRDVSEDDLAKRGSETINLARKGEKALTGVETTIGGGLSIGMAAEVAKGAQQAEGALEIIQRLVVEYWLILLIGGALFIAARYGKRILRAIKGERVRKAQTGQDLRL